MAFVYGAIQVGLIVLVAGAGLMGVIAMISPRLFVAVSAYGNEVLNRKGAECQDRWFDIDNYVHTHARLFGILATATCGFVWFVSSHGPEAYSKSFMLSIVMITMITGIAALAYMRFQNRAIEKRSEEANSDPLTGLYNRRMFDVELSRRLAQRQRQGMPVCLMIIDVDDFKKVNDAYGHQVGDETLKHIAEVLKEHSREMDIVSRIGGDEFAVILPGSNLDDSSASAARLAKAIGDSGLGLEDKELSPTVSIGLAEADLDDDTISLLRRTDAVLYAAKEAGRNCCYRQGIPEPAVPTPC